MAKIHDILIEEELSIEEYDLATSPNDFNIKTLIDFIKSGLIEVGAFQRNYVWDIKKASKLIESIILGLPIPQVFLYEKSKDKYSVIDGQQRLMTIYYFGNGKFPKLAKRVELRRIFDEEGYLPEKIFADKKYFEDFDLILSNTKLNALNYQTLGDQKRLFEMRTIRCILIKQLKPSGDSSMYEIFNRLNTGGVNLKPQEIRMSLYHSDFYAMLSRINLNPAWRKLLGDHSPDIHMIDIEILLRGFALFLAGDKYKSPMVKFLNDFSNTAKHFNQQKNSELERLFDTFIEITEKLPKKSFYSSQKKFSVPLFEAVFASECFLFNKGKKKELSEKVLQDILNDKEFKESLQLRATSKNAISTRLAIASKKIS